MFLYTSNKLSEKEIMKTILFTIAAKSMKYLEINWFKECKICSLKPIGHYWKKLKKTHNINKFKKNTSKLKMPHFHVLEELMLLKYLYFWMPSIDSMIQSIFIERE